MQLENTYSSIYYRGYLKVRHDLLHLAGKK